MVYARLLTVFPLRSKGFGRQAANFTVWREHHKFGCPQAPGERIRWHGSTVASVRIRVSPLRTSGLGALTVPRGNQQFRVHHEKRGPAPAAAWREGKAASGRARTRRPEES